MDWLLSKLPTLIFVTIVIVQIVRGISKARRQDPTPEPRHNELEQARRNEEIRRRIAERRAGHTSPPPEPARTEPPPVIERDPTAIPDLPEPLKRMLTQLEKRREPRPTIAPPSPPLPPERSRAELERQYQLAEEMKALEEERLLAKRRAAQLAAAQAEAATTKGALRTAARGRLLEDLKDPQSLRRAVVLREVLGTPVGLR